MENNMKAARINGYGESDVVEFDREAPVPPVSEGKLLIGVRAAGVNPFDWKVRAGYFQEAMPLQFPVTLGGDFAGVVMEVGVGVTRFNPGDEVYGQANVFSGGSGAFAEIVLADQKSVAIKPKTTDFIEAAALPLTGVSAYQALVENIGLSEGWKILIHGGAGGIGTVAIQLAKHLGAYVATTAVADETPYVRGLGADEVIDYRTERFEDIVHNFDAVYDTVGGDTYTRSYKVLKQGGVILSMLEQPNETLMAEHGVKAIYQFTQVTSERLSKLAGLVDGGSIKARIDRIFPLGQAGDALAYLQQDHPRGKVVLEIARAGEAGVQVA